MKKLLLLIMLFATTQTIASPVLVETDWLAANTTNKNIIIVDTSDHTQHLRFHIPGAIHIDYSEITYKRKKDKVSIQVPNDYFMQILSKYGISNDSYIVIYDDMGGFNAGRLFWHLEQIGHSKVSVLNGGLVKWINEHRKISNKNTKRLPTSYTKNTSGMRDNLADMSSFKTGSELLIDARSKEEYIGHPKFPRTGHIPKAALWNWQDNVDFENAFIIKNSMQISKQQKHIDFSNKKQSIITYCRSGHRASQTYLTLRSMGFENIKLYDASMAEYSQYQKAPLEKGCSKC